MVPQPLSRNDCDGSTESRIEQVQVTAGAGEAVTAAESFLDQEVDS